MVGALMHDGEQIEREWRYGPPVGRIAMGALYFVSSTLILGLATLLQSRGLAPARNLPVSKETGTIILAVLTGLSLLMAALGIWGLSRKDLHKRRIVLTQNSILLPRRPWSKDEIEIDFASVRKLTRFRILNHRFVRIRHDGGKHDIDSQWFGGQAGFEEIGRVLDERCTRAERG